MGRRRLNRKTAILCLTGVILILSLAVSCRSPFLETIEAVVKEYSTPVPTINFEDSSGIAQDTQIIITYSETMDTATLSIPDDGLGAECDGGSWSTETYENDTLTISPSSAWSTGSGKTLDVTCFDFDGYETTVSVTYGVLDGIVYVRTPGDGGSDTNPGTWDQPKGTIQDAIDTAAAVYSSADVYVAEGNYTPTSSIICEDGISLWGGFSAASTDWSVRETDPDWAVSGDFDSDYPTKIETSSEFGVLRFSDTSTPIIVEGFYIDGGVSGSNTTGIYVDTTSNITIRSNNIDGGGGTLSVALALNYSTDLMLDSNKIYGGVNGTSTAIECNVTPATLTNNIISGGSSGNFANTIGIYNIGSAMTIAYNDIYGGDSWNMSIAVWLDTDADSLIYNNIIDAGVAAENSGPVGIAIDASAPIIRSNTISGGSLTSGSSINEGPLGIMVFNSATPTIENNIIFTENCGGTYSRIGIMASSSIVFNSLKNNDIFDCDQALFAWDTYDDPGSILNIAEINALTNASGNLSSIDPVFVDQPGGDWHLLDTSSGIDNGLNGDSEGWSFTDDLDGNVRSTTGTAAWCIGAYEYAP